MFPILWLALWLAGLQVQLAPRPDDQRIETRAGADGAFTVEHIVPRAEYDIAVEPLPPGTWEKDRCRKRATGRG